MQMNDGGQYEICRECEQVLRDSGYKVITAPGWRMANCRICKRRGPVYLVRWEKTGDS